jgi:hypothetical protein
VEVSKQHGGVRRLGGFLLAKESLDKQEEEDSDSDSDTYSLVSCQSRSTELLLFRTTQQLVSVLVRMDNTGNSGLYTGTMDRRMNQSTP